MGVSVACLDEAVVLRNAGIQKPILVLGCVFPEQYEAMVRYEIRAAVYTKEMAVGMANAAEQIGKTAYFHIKIDTGMGRIGFPVTEESAETILEISELKHGVIEGMFTHFAKADEADKSYTRMKHERFVWMREVLEEKNVSIPYIDCDNSAGIIDFPDLKHDLARAGISLYGMYPSEEVDHQVIDLKPALELVSHVTFVKKVEAGTSISYGGTFVAEKPMKVATIPVGYGDGYPRSLSNCGEVLIRGKRARILGRVCMDQFMVDVTEIPDVQFMRSGCSRGRTARNIFPWKNSVKKAGVFRMSLFCCLGKRIPRVYIRDGEVTEQTDCFA